MQEFLKELTHDISYDIKAPASGLDEARIERNTTSVEKWFLFLVNYACDRDAFNDTLKHRQKARNR